MKSHNTRWKHWAIPAVISTQHSWQWIQYCKSHSIQKNLIYIGATGPNESKVSTFDSKLYYTKEQWWVIYGWRNTHSKYRRTLQNKIPKLSLIISWKEIPNNAEETYGKRKKAQNIINRKEKSKRNRNNLRQRLRMVHLKRDPFISYFQKSNLKFSNIDSLG